MSGHIVLLKRRQEVAEGTMAFFFAKPPAFTFKPGQFCDFTLLDPPETDAEGNTRAFSIASAPQEEDLVVATRMRDTAFKRVLKTMPLGTEVQIEGPMGNLTLHNNAARAGVFLTGGIGITPFRSLVLHAAKSALPHSLFLFYSNRRPEDAAFLEELQAVQKHNPKYRFVATMTQADQSKRPWQGETGYIRREMLQRFLTDLANPIYYIAGPPAMVSAMRTMLNEAGVNDDDIRTEEFAGY